MKIVSSNQLKILDGPPEDDAPLWNASTSYAVNQDVIRNHYIYRAKVANQNTDPATSLHPLPESKWRLMGPTNRYACIDIYNFTQTVSPTKAEPLIIKVPYELPATAVTLLNMTAIQVDVSIDAADGENYLSKTYNLLEDSRHEWDYWFGPFRFKKDIIITRIAPVSGTLTMTLYSPDKAAVGMIVVGQEHDLGPTLYGASAGFVNYSKFTADDFGTVTYVRRNNARRASFPFYVHPDDSNYVHNVISQFNGEPVLCVGDNEVGFEPLMIWGKIKEFDDQYEDVNKNNATCDVEGIV